MRSDRYDTTAAIHTGSHRAGLAVCRRTAATAFVVWLVLLAGCGAPPGQRAFRKALRKIDENDLVRAARLLEKAAAESPTDAIIQNYLGVVYWELDDLERAREALETSSRLDEHLFDPAYNLGVLLAESDETHDAIQAFEDAARLAPEDARPVEYLARIYAAQEDRAKAYTLLTEAYRREPGNPRVLTALANAQYRRGDGTSAVERLHMVLAEEPGYDVALYNMGVIQRDALKQKLAARTYFEQYLAVTDDEDYAQRARDAIARMATHPPPTRPIIKTPSAQPPPARKPAPALPAPTPANATTHRPAPPTTRTATPTPQPTPQPTPPQQTAPAQARAPSNAALLSQARSAIEREELDLALILLKQATRGNPRDPDTLWELAALYDRQLEQQEKARDVYLQFVARFPNDARAARARRRTSELTGHPQRAPDSPHPNPRRARDLTVAKQHFKKGQQYQEQKQLTQAIHYYKRAIESDDSYYLAYYNLGTAYAARGEQDRAAQAYQAVLRIRTDMVNARYNLALIHKNTGNRSLAAQELERVIRTNHSYMAAHFALAQIYAQDSATHGLARTYYASYLKLKPHGPYAQRARDWLRRHPAP